MPVVAAARLLKRYFTFGCAFTFDAGFGAVDTAVTEGCALTFDTASTVGFAFDAAFAVTFGCGVTFVAFGRGFAFDGADTFGEFAAGRRACCGSADGVLAPTTCGTDA